MPKMFRLKLTAGSEGRAINPLSVIMIGPDNDTGGCEVYFATTGQGNWVYEKFATPPAEAQKLWEQAMGYEHDAPTG